MFWHVSPPLAQMLPSVLFLHRISLHAPQRVLFSITGLPAGSCAFDVLAEVLARQRGDATTGDAATAGAGAAGAAATSVVAAPASEPMSSIETSNSRAHRTFISFSFPKRVRAPRNARGARERTGVQDTRHRDRQCTAGTGDWCCRCCRRRTPA